MKTTEQSAGFHSLDIIGSKFNFSFNSSTGRFQTKIGGYITVLMSLFSLGVFTLITSQIFDTDSPIVTASNEFGSKIVSFQLYDEEIITPIMLENRGQFITDQIERYTTIRLEVSTFAENKETKKMEVAVAQTYEYVPCTTIKDQHVLDVMNKLISTPDFISFNLCPDFKGTQKEYSVTHNLIENSFRMVTFSFFPCSLENPADCASEEELRRTTVSFPRIDKFLDPSDKSDPLRTNPVKEGIKLDARNTKYRQYKVIQNKIVDDDSLVSGPRTKITYATAEQESMDTNSRDSSQLHCSKQSIALGFRSPCDELLNFEFLPSSQVRITRRSYKKLTQIFGEFGGVLKIATTIVVFFYSIYSGRRMNSFILDSIFGFKTKNDQHQLRRLIEGGGLASRTPEKEKQFRDNLGEGVKGSEVEEAMKYYVKSSCDVLDILRKLAFVELLENVFLTENQRKLLPVILLKLKVDQRAKTQAKNPKYSSTRVESSQNSPLTETKLFSKKVNQGEKSKLKRDKLHQKQGSQEPRDQGHSYQSLFLELMKSTPESEVEKKINHFLVENLGRLFNTSEIESKMGQNCKNKVKILSQMSMNQHQLRAEFLDDFTNKKEVSKPIPITPSPTKVYKNHHPQPSPKESSGQLPGREQGPEASPEHSPLKIRRRPRFKSGTSKLSFIRKGSRSNSRIQSPLKFKSAVKLEKKKRLILNEEASEE